ncbi:hypothetical protein LHK_01265 [Laribacter hongkongensis HLHK9]|uniref:Uncharacterized protein n=2 Tax=Laribacter hongkongensis TaxID=168471 RepID=C1D715_LARHH|nr:hypothetical protein LHK_01265 [Laribacter hongkongensis HLHK9]ASJ24254.1 hypothetical protein LHGZ1_1423 [Laribacter hongkongensis]
MPCRHDPVIPFLPRWFCHAFIPVVIVKLKLSAINYQFNF